MAGKFLINAIVRGMRFREKNLSVAHKLQIMAKRLSGINGQLIRAGDDISRQTQLINMRKRTDVEIQDISKIPRVIDDIWGPSSELETGWTDSGPSYDTDVIIGARVLTPNGSILEVRGWDGLQALKAAVESGEILDLRSDKELES